MTAPRPRTRDHIRLVDRLVALAEAYGCADLEGMRADLDAVVHVEILVLHRRVRTAQEHARRVALRSAVCTICHRAECACPPQPAP